MSRVIDSAETPMTESQSLADKPHCAHCGALLTPSETSSLALCIARLATLLVAIRKITAPGYEYKNAARIVAEVHRISHIEPRETP